MSEFSCIKLYPCKNGDWDFRVQKPNCTPNIFSLASLVAFRILSPLHGVLLKLCNH